MGAKRIIHGAFAAANVRVMRTSTYEAMMEQIAQLSQQVDHLESAVARHESTIGVLDGHIKRGLRTQPAWYENLATEPGVQLALADIVRPGDVCFDVGAFQGDMALHLSRLVGPKGLVCAFEANPETVPALTANCAANILRNVHLVHAAVWHTSGEWVNMGPQTVGMHAGASVVSASNGHIETITLDDFAARYDLRPNVVKMDIEGAEIHAVKGFVRVLKEVKPHLVLEHNCGDDSAMNFLLELGYKAFCTNQYIPVRSSADLLPGSMIRNILYIHADRLPGTPYQNLKGRELVKVLTADAAKVEGTPNGAARSSFEFRLNLPAGRYLATAEFHAEKNDVLSFQSITRRGIQGQYYEQFERFYPNCRDLPFDVPQPQEVVLRLLQVVNGMELAPAPRLTLKEIRIERAAGFGSN